jgi:hypothetical protein
MTKEIRMTKCEGDHWVRLRRRPRSSLALRRGSFVTGLIVVALFAANDQAIASGETFSLNGHDLQVDVDSRWVGCGQGGYCPIRVRVVNRGPTRTLTFRVAKSYQPIVGVRQTLEVPQNAALSLTLPVPMVNFSTSAEFRVEDSGGVLENMKHSVALPEVNLYEVGRPGMVVVAPGVVDLQPFEDGATTFRGTGGGTAGYSSGGGFRPGGVHSANCIALPPNSLPGSWIDYSGLDLISISLPDLEKLPKGTRSALIQWARCGGTLLVSGAGDPETAGGSAAKLLVGDAALASTWSWSEPKLSDRDVTQIVHLDASSGSTSISSPAASAADWPRETLPFRVADVGFGKLVLFRGEPFPGTAQDWFWLLKSIGGIPRWDWGKRHGESARVGTSDFLLFLIPGIGGVPVVMFLVLITVFAIVIGPLNYFVLARRKQLHLLLLTIPAVAIITSVLLFSYTIIAHGFSVKARCRSLTYIDQSAQSAVTLGRISLYAGQAPSAGMQFSRDTAVYPIWPEHEEFESGQVDWTNSQNLTSGWLRSRTRTQFLTVGHRTERGRLEVTSSGADKLTVANGFEWGFEPLVVANEQGRLFVAKNVAAGASIDLQPASEDELKQVATALQRHPLELPSGLASAGSVSGSFWGPPRPRYRGGVYYGYGYGYGTASWHHNESLMETAWLRLRAGTVIPGNATPPGVSPEVSPVPRTFYGLATQTPHVEIGVAKVTEVNSLHVVMGRW